MEADAGVEPSISQATSACREQFSRCLGVEQLMINEWAENRSADFNLWASGIGASAPGRASLDARLMREPAARTIVANLLELLTATILQCTTNYSDTESH